MTAAEIHSRLKEKFGERIGELTGELDPTCVVLAESVAAVCEWLRDEPGLDMTSLMCLSSVDYKDKLAVVYNLHSLIHNHKITLKVEFTDRENPHVPSVAGVWATADWHEREAYDMMGIVFDGHPDLRRILCPDDWEGWPLRKDYKVQETYRGLVVPYPEGLNPDRGHWMFRDIPYRPTEKFETREPDLDGI